VTYVAQNLHQMKEASALLRRVVSTDGVQSWAKGQALVFLGQRFGKEELPFFRTLLKDDTETVRVYLGNDPMGQPIQVACQVRDVALALLIAHTEQDLRTYGFKFTPGTNVNPKNIGYGSYAFASDEDRDSALKRFGEWEAKRRIDEKPPEKK
jgi:hypothetical protein